MRELIKEFRPALTFILKFIGLYFALNLLYGWYIDVCNPKPDHVTKVVTRQSGKILDLFYEQVEVRDHPFKPTTTIFLGENPVVTVFEGCNGVNVLIVFLSFIFAYGPLTGKLVWFLSLGFLLIHLANLARISLLFAVSYHMPDYLYFTHKYLFTSFIFLIVFLMWAAWVFRISKE
ncbi:MAG: exosortase family protein XrtF [Cyclobacteriaceae bacterium]|nr:exosortase family protein XrtF [Cyclobacteriaceae bacterium]